MRVKVKRILFWLILLTLAYAAVELMCFLASKSLEKRFPFFDFKKYFADEMFIKSAYRSYHPERGWDNVYTTKFGERPRGIEYNKALISVFGDSYINCQGVEDNETWEEHLSILLQENIYNFGVGGYGTDQAYLKFLSIFPRVRTPIVILGLTPENINRIVNVYRPFYYQETGIKFTKPRFILKQDRLYLLPNPVRSLDQTRGLRDARFLSRIGRNDYWFSHDRYPEFSFPYVKILFDKRIWFEIIHRRLGIKISDINPQPDAGLWGDGESAALMFKILESFITKAKDYGAVPIIMILPHEIEVVEKFKHGSSAVGEKKILDFCRKNNILVFDSIEALARHANSISEIEAFFNGHVSARGNQIIAQYLYNFLKGSVLSTNQ